MAGSIQARNISKPHFGHLQCPIGLFVKRLSL
jgi:hypothetical protein